MVGLVDHSLLGREVSWERNTPCDFGPCEATGKPAMRMQKVAFDDGRPCGWMCDRGDPGECRSRWVDRMELASPGCPVDTGTTSDVAEGDVDYLRQIDPGGTLMAPLSVV